MQLASVTRLAINHMDINIARSDGREQIIGIGIRFRLIIVIPFLY